jgi:hypothetical protein
MTQLNDKIISFIDNPFPLWENDLTALLVKNEIQRLSQIGITLENYSTAGSYFQKRMEIESESILLSGTTFKDSIYLEKPQFNVLNDFYEEHGLEIEPESKVGSVEAGKLKGSLSIFEFIPESHKCISTLVKRIQVLKQVEDEIDTSYSHPEIPFSIFISLCRNNSLTSNLRVAESILHEAMHLKLTLIEKHVDLINPNSSETFYSPWRYEQRPIRGVLHGLFVFRSILEMYKLLLNSLINFNDCMQIYYRIEDIENEFRHLKRLSMNQGFTSMGSSLVNNLLPLN